MQTNPTEFRRERFNKPYRRADSNGGGGGIYFEERNVSWWVGLDEGAQGAGEALDAEKVISARTQSRPERTDRVPQTRASRKKILKKRRLCTCRLAGTSILKVVWPSSSTTSSNSRPKAKHRFSNSSCAVRTHKQGSSSPVFARTPGKEKSFSFLRRQASHAPNSAAGLRREHDSLGRKELERRGPHCIAFPVAQRALQRLPRQSALQGVARNFLSRVKAGTREKRGLLQTLFGAVGDSLTFLGAEFSDS